MEKSGRQSWRTSKKYFMAKKSKKNEDETKKVVANCNNPDEVVANIETPQETSLSQYDIEKLIVTVRGEQVLIDQDIAKIYGVTTKRLNQQAKRNIARFPSSFRFELTKEEVGEVVANCDHLQSMKFRPTLPYAFTEQGIGKHQIETDQKMDMLLDRMDKQSPKLLPEQIFATGCVWDAWTYVSDLVRSAKQRIVLIDNFVDDRVLSLLDKRADNVEATIHSRYYESFQTDLKKHNEQYREIKFIQLPQKNHDRFLIIDNNVYLLGASVKDMGVGMCAVTKMQVSAETILQLLK